MMNNTNPAICYNIVYRSHKEEVNPDESNADYLQSFLSQACVHPIGILTIVSPRTFKSRQSVCRHSIVHTDSIDTSLLSLNPL